MHPPSLEEIPSAWEALVFSASRKTRKCREPSCALCLAKRCCSFGMPPCAAVLSSFVQLPVASGHKLDIPAPSLPRGGTGQLGDLYSEDGPQWVLRATPSNTALRKCHMTFSSACRAAQTGRSRGTLLALDWVGWLGASPADGPVSGKAKCRLGEHEGRKPQRE